MTIFDTVHGTSLERKICTLISPYKVDFISFPGIFNLVTCSLYFCLNMSPNLLLIRTNQQLTSVYHLYCKRICMSFFSFLPTCIDFSLEGYKFIGVEHYYVLPSLHQLKSLPLQLPTYIHVAQVCVCYICSHRIPTLLFVFISDFVTLFFSGPMSETWHEHRHYVACEQAPKWGIGRKEKSARARYGAFPLLFELDFCLRPRPQLGALSQAIPTQP